MEKCTLVLNQPLDSLSTTTKNDIKNNILGKRNIVSITPEIQDPDYLYVTIDSTVKYDSSKTENTSKL